MTPRTAAANAPPIQAPGPRARMIDRPTAISSTGQSCHRLATTSSGIQPCAQPRAGPRHEAR